MRLVLDTNVLLSGIWDVYDDARFGAMKETGLELELETSPVKPGFEIVEALEPGYLP